LRPRSEVIDRGSPDNGSATPPRYPDPPSPRITADGAPSTSGRTSRSCARFFSPAAGLQDPYCEPAARPARAVTDAALRSPTRQQGRSVRHRFARVRSQHLAQPPCSVT
jgi:hypothetical protein